MVPTGIAAGHSGGRPAGWRACDRTRGRCASSAEHARDGCAYADRVIELLPKRASAPPKTSARAGRRGLLGLTNRRAWKRFHVSLLGTLRVRAMACRARLAPAVPAALARDAEPRRRLVADAAVARRAPPRAPPPSAGAPASASPPRPTTPSRVPRRGALLGAALFLGLGAPTAAAPARAAAAPVTDEAFASLEMRARTAYRAKRLDEAYALLTELHELEPSDGRWLERRAQCLVDLKRFEDAIADFDAAVALYEPEYKSLGLLSNRALAYEGLSDWKRALRDYDEVVRLSSAVDRAPPYVLNSRGNVLSSLGRYEDALESYRLSAETFQKSRNLSGAIYARSNAALMLAELGREDDAVSEFEAVARRAAGSIDARAALAAMRWSRGEVDEAETTWNWACEKINSGVLTEGGPALDGCALYRDEDWLRRVRRWPPSMVDKQMRFVRLQR